MSFEEEFEILASWYRQKVKEYLEASEKTEVLELDSELNALHREDTKEYNRRLTLLRVKYGKELDEWDKEFLSSTKIKE